ncbi:hypothetical protein PV325_005823 [Microctonus aethiopoides]|nr:hypothetical protein PV325_005823 [Microctonus aethiopoides]
MFALVRFDNCAHYVLPSKRVKIIQGKNCVAKHRNGAKYNGYVMEYSDSKEDLMKMQKKLSKQKDVINDGDSTFNTMTEHDNFLQNKVGFSTPINSSTASMSDLEISNISSKNQSIVPSTILESSDPPSGYTEQFNSLESNWPGTSDEHNSHNIQLPATYELSQSLSQISSGAQSNLENTTNNSHTDNIIECTEDNSNSTQSKNVNETSNMSENVDDPNYDPSESIQNVTIENTAVFEKSSIKENSLLFDNGNPVDVRELTVPESHAQKSSKRYMCPFCKTLQTKFQRHLVNKHENEKDVKEFMAYKPSHPNRRSIIAKLRKEGNFLHNTKPEFNTGILIVTRQRQKKSKNTVEDYVCCNGCKGFYARSTIRIHYKKCNKSYTKNARNILSSGRRLSGYIHMCACTILRRNIFPVLRDDDVSRCIRYDELIIQFGNKLCDKYTLNHQHDMIRAQLRLLGRFKIEIMKQNKQIHEFKDVFKPQNFDDAINTLRKIANWDDKIMWFRTPAVAQNLIGLMKKCARKLRTECIKIQDYEKKKSVEDFLLLWEEEVPTLISKKALEDQVTQKRQKKVVLPSKQDIKLLYDYLKKECCTCLEILGEEFNKDAWMLLTQCTLIFIQIFNRQRAGEIERLTLTNYENKEELDENIDPDLYKQFSNSTKEFAKQFVRLVLRGKLGRTVSVLLNPFVVECIETIIKFRKQAGVKSDNEYIFSDPHANKLSKKYLRACPLMRRFANECGALIPSALRGTTLRKHIATYTSMLNIEEHQVDRLANFMGHHKDIHKNIYRVPVSVAEITDVSRLLMAAVGDDQKDDDEGCSDDNENSDSSNDEDEPTIPSRIARNNTIMDASNESCEGSGNISTTQFEESSTSYEHQNASHKKRKRSMWSAAEKNAIMKYFGNLGDLEKLPSLKKCKEVIAKNDVLKERTPAQLKTWIDNQRRAKIRQNRYKKSKQI